MLSVLLPLGPKLVQRQHFMLCRARTLQIPIAGSNIEAKDLQSITRITVFELASRATTKVSRRSAEATLRTTGSRIARANPRTTLSTLSQLRMSRRQNVVDSVDRSCEDSPCMQEQQGAKGDGTAVLHCEMQ